MRIASANAGNRVDPYPTEAPAGLLAGTWVKDLYIIRTLVIICALCLVRGGNYAGKEVQN
jgi:hypothetical protein